MYEVEYEHGHKVAMAVNAIASNIFTQIDQDGERFVLFDEIIDWRTDGLHIKSEDSFIHISNKNKRGCGTTKGRKSVSNGRMGAPHGIQSKT